MNFIDLSKSFILKNSTVFDDNLREYILGEQVEIISMKKKDENNLVAKNLSSTFTEDKFMRKYSPVNTVYFTRSFLSDENEKNFASCHIDTKSCRVFVGSANEFEGNSGVLVFSGFLSLNNLVEDERLILCNSRMLNTIKKRVKILALGLRGDKLFGLYLIPNQRGIAVSLQDAENLGISTVSLKQINCERFNELKIDDWFVGAKITEKGEI